MLVASRASAQSQPDRPDIAIDVVGRTTAIQNLARAVESNYPDAVIGAAVARDLETGLRTGRYADTSAKRLASILTADLRRVSGDPHFLVDYFVVLR